MQPIIDRDIWVRKEKLYLSPLISKEACYMPFSLSTALHALRQFWKIIKVLEAVNYKICSKFNTVTTLGFLIKLSSKLLWKKILTVNK